MLDHRLLEFAGRMPRDFIYWDGKGDWPPRRLLYIYPSQELMVRPKKGFRMPIEHWLRHPLREWAGELLDEKRLR